MAPNSQKDHNNKLGKVGKEAFDLLSELMPRRRKVSSQLPVPVPVPVPVSTTTLVQVPDGYDSGAQCIDANQAAIRYGGYLMTTTGSQIRTVKQPKPVKANVHSVYQYQHYYHGQKTGY